MSATDTLTLILPLALCCIAIPMLFNRQPGQSSSNSEADAWFVESGIQETYDAIVKESDGWQDEAESKPSRFSLLPRRKGLFVVNKAVPPRLYRVKDEGRGEISFELTEVENGGTSVKATYDPRARVLIQNFKAKMPIKIPGSPLNPKTCPPVGSR